MHSSHESSNARPGILSKWRTKLFSRLQPPTPPPVHDKIGTSSGTPGGGGGSGTVAIENHLKSFPTLPFDIAERLFEEAASADRKTAMVLSLVSKQVQRWY